MCKICVWRFFTQQTHYLNWQCITHEYINTYMSRPDVLPSSVVCSLERWIYKSSFKVCSETRFTKNSYHIETSKLQRFANQLTGFYMIRDFTERYFLTDYNFIFSLNVVIIGIFKHIRIIKEDIWVLTLNKYLSLKC